MKIIQEIKAEKRWCCLFLAGLFCILILRYRDHYHFEYDGGGYLEAYEQAEEDEYRGLAASVGGLHLKPGDYRLQVELTSWGPDNYLRIVDTAYSDGVQVQDQVLYSAKYEKGITENTYEFSLSKEAGNVCIQSFQMDGSLDITGYQLDSVQPYYTDTWFLAGLWILLWLAAAWKREWLRSERSRPFLILCGTGLAVSLPLFTDFLGYGHDVLYHLQRLSGLIQSLTLGDQLPVRVNMAFNDGYGQLTSVMYPELFLYLPGILGVCGVSLLIALKALVILVNVGTGLISYYSMKTVTGERAAFWFALLYMMSPYRLNNLYARFALGEYLAMTFLPLLFAGIWHIVCGDHRKWWMAAAGCCCVLQSHLLTTEMSAFFTAGFVLMNPGFLREPRRVVQALKAVLVSVLLNLWYLIPFLQFMGFHFRVADTPRYLGENGVYFSQMFSILYSPYGDKVIGSTYQDMSLTVGLTLLIGTGLYVLHRRAILERAPGLKKLLDPFLVLGLLAVYMASWLFPWKLVYQSDLLVRMFGMIQFSWRFLIFVTFFLTLLTAMVMDWCQDERKQILGVLAVCMVVSVVILENGYMYENQSILTSKYDQSYEDYVYDGYYKKNYGTWIPMTRGNVVSLDQDVGLVTEHYERKGTRLSFDFEITGGDGNTEYVMTLPYYNYGFYEAELDQEPVETFSDDQELVAIYIPAGTKDGHVELHYEERRLYMLGNAVSLLSLLAVLALAGGGYFRKKGTGAS